MGKRRGLIHLFRVDIERCIIIDNSFHWLKVALVVSLVIMEEKNTINVICFRFNYAESTQFFSKAI